MMHMKLWNPTRRTQMMEVRASLMGCAEKDHSYHLTVPMFTLLQILDGSIQEDHEQDCMKNLQSAIGAANSATEESRRTWIQQLINHISKKRGHFPGSTTAMSRSTGKYKSSNHVKGKHQSTQGKINGASKRIVKGSLKSKQKAQPKLSFVSTTRVTASYVADIALKPSGSQGYRWPRVSMARLPMAKKKNKRTHMQTPCRQ